MVTDPARVRRSDPGHPEVCPVFSLHRLISPAETVASVDAACRQAAIGCVDCKRELALHLNRRLDPIRARRAEILARPARIGEVLAAGRDQARQAAAATMGAVRERMHLNRGAGAAGHGI
jgi:tryptophanyl-tRNA synthetase